MSGHVPSLNLLSVIGHTYGEHCLDIVGYITENDPIALLVVRLGGEGLDLDTLNYGFTILRFGVIKYSTRLSLAVGIKQI